MRYLRQRHPSVLIVLSLLMLMSLALGGQVQAAPGEVAAQQTPVPPGGAGTQVVPGCDPAVATCNTFEFGGAWVVDPDASMTGQGGGFALEHQTLANTTFQYFETPWVANHVADNGALIAGWVSGILSALGQVAPSPVATGNLADGSLWHLYAVPFGPETYGMLVTADTADPSQNDVISMLISPASGFDQALAAVQADIRVNGASPLAGIDPVQAMTALGGGAVQTPATGTTPVPGTTPAAPPTPGVSLTQSATVGTDSIAYGGDWQYDTANSSAEVGIFEYVPDPRVSFGYLQGVDRTSGGDAQIALQILDPPTAFEAQSAQLVASETLPSGKAYALYTWERPGGSETALFVVDVTTTPGTVRVETLFAPPDQFVAVLASAQQSFQINGVGAFSELDPAAIASLLGVATTPTPAAGTTPAVATTPTPSGLTLPPIGGTTTPVTGTTPTPTTSAVGQTVTVGGATITYAGGWIYDTVNSTPDEIAFFDNDAVTAGFYGYQVLTDSTGNALLALQQFNAPFLTSMGATTVAMVTEQTLPGGQAWALYTADLGGLPIAVLTHADVTTAPGQFRLQLLLTEAATLETALVDVQAMIQIDGAVAFAGVDPAAVSALLGGGAPTTPAIGTTPAAATTGSLADYQARDAATGCDGIGWVVTDPSQAPVTQADIDYRGACVGGATYVAACGLADMAGVPYLQCDLEVTVTGAPMTISAQHITLVDGSGTVYPVDSEITTLMTGIFGQPTLPETTVGPGAPVSGTIFLFVPMDAPTPWVLQVAPETIAATGEAPGVLVFEAAPQPGGIGAS
jgi:hypothetical protein